jgi:hypothetical protein
VLKEIELGGGEFEEKWGQNGKKTGKNGKKKRGKKHTSCGENPTRRYFMSGMGNDCNRKECNYAE